MIMPVTRLYSEPGLYIMPFGIQARQGLGPGHGAIDQDLYERAVSDIRAFCTEALEFRQRARPRDWLLFVAPPDLARGGEAELPNQVALHDAPRAAHWLEPEHRIKECFRVAYAPVCHPPGYGALMDNLDAYLKGSALAGIESGDFLGIVQEFETAAGLAALQDPGAPIPPMPPMPLTTSYARALERFSHDPLGYREVGVAAVGELFGADPLLPVRIERQGDPLAGDSDPPRAGMVTLRPGDDGEARVYVSLHEHGLGLPERAWEAAVVRVAGSLDRVYVLRGDAHAEDILDQLTDGGDLPARALGAVYRLGALEGHGDARGALAPGQGEQGQGHAFPESFMRLRG
jgi:hypothetical protein